MTRREGFSMIEMVVALSTGSALMVIAIGLVHRTMTIHSAVELDANLQKAAARLSRDLRRDLHRSTSFALTDETLTLEFDSKSFGEAPVYYFAKGKVRREQSRDENRRREYYDFGPQSEIHVDGRTDPQRIEFLIRERTPITHAPGRLLLRVEAVVGRFPGNLR